MLEVVFSDSAAGTMAVAIGHKGFLGGATSVIISDGTVSKEEIEKFQHQAEERERSGWENAIPLEGNRKDIVNLPLALSVGNISEAGICLERESALSLLLSILPDMASEIVTELLNTSRKNYATLLEKAQNGEPIRVWVGRDPDDVCGLYWLLEQLRPIGFEKLDITIVELPMWETRPDGCIVQYNGWGEVEPYHLGRMASLGKKLPTNYLRSLANRWRELQQENSPLRAVINGKLVSVSETLYDTFILRELDTLDDEFRESVLVGQVLGKNQLGIGDGWIALRVEQFIKEGLLLPTMKPLKDVNAGNDVVKNTPESVSNDVKAEPEKIDFSKVEIEPLFKDFVDFETFSKSDFRAVKVLACEAVPKSKKLLKFTLDDGSGENRTILSGIHAYYEPEELVGKTCIAITNLPPRPMMGIDSCGMLISAVHHEEGEEKLHLLMVDDHIPAGAKLY